VHSRSFLKQAMHSLRIPLVCFAVHAAAVKILPLGDSITLGCGDRCEKDCTKIPQKFMPAPCSNCSNGYRSSLWRSLKAAKVLGDFEVVGSLESGNDDMPRRHEGHAGKTIKEVHELSSTWLPFNADIILLHLGTNDMGIGFQNAKNSAKRMDLMLNDTFSSLPKTHIFLASIIDTGAFYGGKNHAEFNAALKVMVSKYTEKGFQIAFVDMEAQTGLCTADMCCPDDIHPLNEGYAKMAQVWFEALKNTFGSELVVV